MNDLIKESCKKGEAFSKPEKIVGLDNTGGPRYLPLFTDIQEEKG